MALINRVARLFRADLHAVLDRIEEPLSLLQQAVREMQAELAAEQRRERLLRHELGEIDARAQTLSRQLARSEEELEVCFAAGQDDLARATLRNRLQAQRGAASLERRRSIVEADLQGLASRIQEHAEQLEAMRQKAELMAERDAAEETAHRVQPESWTAGAVRDAEVEIAFLREKQRRSRR